MLRSFFIALGIFSVILGLECLLIDEVVWRSKKPAQAQSAFSLQAARPAERWQTPDWAPWSLLSGGAITILYAIVLPKRFSGGGG